MRMLLAAMIVLTRLGPQAGLACFPLTDEALKATSWSISKTNHGTDLSVFLLNTGRFGTRAVTGATGLIRFVSATSEKSELNLKLETAIAPGTVAEQHYSVTGWDRLLSIPPTDVTVTTCVQSMEFADGGTLIVN